jgi:hypothetical protein
MTRVTERILQNRHSQFEQFNLEDTELSIQLSLDGFSFCIRDGLSGNHLLLERYGFDKQPSPEEYLTWVRDIVENTVELNTAFRSVKVVHSNDLVTQVPLALFDKDKLEEYLKFTVKLLENDYISFDVLESKELVNVYIPFVNINNYLVDRYGPFVYKHSATVLVESLLNSTRNVDAHRMFVHAYPSSFELVVTGAQRLLLYNHFNYATSEDFIYYILFVAEQLDLNPEEIQLTIMGDLEKDSDCFRVVYQYIRHVDFHKPFQTPELFKKNPPHANYLLLNL